MHYLSRCGLERYCCILVLTRNWYRAFCDTPSLVFPGDDFPVRLRFADLPAQVGQQAGVKPVRARYEAAPPRSVLERGLTTADLKARVALKEKSSVRPPDPDKLGEKQQAKKAHAGVVALCSVLPMSNILMVQSPLNCKADCLAGSAIAKYGEERWAKTFTVHTKNGPRWVAPEVRIAMSRSSLRANER